MVDHLVDSGDYSQRRCVILERTLNDALRTIPANIMTSEIQAVLEKGLQESRSMQWSIK